VQRIGPVIVVGVDLGKHVRAAHYQRQDGSRLRLVAASRRSPDRGMNGCSILRVCQRRGTSRVWHS